MNNTSKDNNTTQSEQSEKSEQSEQFQYTIIAKSYNEANSTHLTHIFPICDN